MLNKFFFWRRALMFLLPGLLLWRISLAESYTLKPKVTIDGPEILLGDVLEPRPERKLASIRLGRLGKPGSSRVISKEFILLRVAKESKESALEIHGQFCLAQASKRVIAGRDLIAFGKQTILKHLALAGGNSKIEIQAPPRAESLVVPDRPVVLHADDYRRNQWRGRVILKVDAEQAGDEGNTETVASTTLSFLVKVVEPQVVASKPIARGQVIGPDNSLVADKDITFEVEEGFGNTLEVYGLSAKRAIGEGALIIPSMLELPVLIRRGDLVRLRVQSGPVKVEILARAQRDGKKGESIPVETVDTHKQVNATVVDSKLVQTLAP